jgi:DNA-binding transcriptional LysR family regulator
MPATGAGLRRIVRRCRRAIGCANALHYFAMDNNHGLLPDLRMFTCVVECQGFSAAARQLGTSTAAISRAIRRLEHALGGPLLHRTTRRIGLTEMGTQLHAQAHERLRELQRALDDVKSGGNQARGVLRVTAAQTFGRRFVSQAVFDFRILYPEIEVEFTLNDDITDLVSSGYHVAIRGGRPRSARVISRPLAPAPLYTCASPALLQRHAAPQRVEQFRDLPCIGFRFRHSCERLAWEFVEDDRQRTVDVKPGLWVDDTEVACEAALAGLGFAQLPGYMALAAIRAGRLVPVLPQTADTSRAFSVVYLHRSDLQPLRERLFVEHLLLSMSDRSDFELTSQELGHWSAASATLANTRRA